MNMARVIPGSRVTIPRKTRDDPGLSPGDRAGFVRMQGELTLLAAIP
jgi:bifunctional DNA-binding transcriptional regulator/antitoxin component of YhaV-PrlF toxin-antitoxin module